MALANSTVQREHDKFVLDGAGNTAVRSLTSGTDVDIRDLVSTQDSVDVPGVATSAKQDDLLTELQLKADLTETQPVQVDALSTIYAGTKTVPTGTAEAIAGSQAIHSVTIKALSTNTVAVYIGGTGITVSGFELLAGESVSLDVSNLATVFVISGSASQVVRYIAV